MSRTRKTGADVTLTNLPAEIQDLVFQHLPQSALHALLLTNTCFTNLAATYLYMAPHFVSTYRYAQFAHCVSHKPHYAEMVRDLDLSYFAKENLDAEGKFLPTASWREFKYRNEAEVFVKELMVVRRRNGTISSHPAPSPHLTSFYHTRDIPIGGLCHVLAACKRIRKLNLTGLQLASDFLLSSPNNRSKEFISTCTTGLLFISDVPKPWTWRSVELQPIYADFIVSHLVTLNFLEELKATNCLWLNTDRVKRLCGDDGPERLVKVDFREGGMEKAVCWAVRGTKEQVRDLVDASVGCSA